MADALDDLVRGLASSTRHNALAYGYSLATTGAFGALAALDHAPDVGDIFLFVIDGSVALRSRP